MTKPTADCPGRRRDRITPALEDRIVRIAEAWQASWGEMTASAFARRVGDILGIRCTRQGLLKRKAVADAFEAQQRALKGSDGKPKRSSDIEILLARVKAREATIAARDEEIRLLRQAIVRHRYNARNRGVSEFELEAPMPLMNSPLERHPKPSPRKGAN